MKNKSKITTWIFGILFIILIFFYINSGSKVVGVILLIIWIILIPLLLKYYHNKDNPNNNTDIDVKKNKLNHEQSAQVKFKSKISNIHFPDRIDTIVWHIKAIEKGLSNSDLNLVNLSYAKLIESIRQQNINEKGKYDEHLKTVREEYDEFRKKYKMEYPPQFLPTFKKKKNMDLKQTEDYQNNEIKNSDKNSIKITINLNDINENLIFDNNEDLIESIAGFYGMVEYSENKDYSISYSDGYYENDRWKNGNLALIKGNILLFKKKVERPQDCLVSNNGNVVCCDWQNSNKLSGKFIIFDCTGNEIFIKKTSANLGKSSISNDGKYAVFETYCSDTNDSNSIFVIDIENRELIKQFIRPRFAFNFMNINSSIKRIRLINNNDIYYEIDFEGNLTNKEEYEEMVMTKGSVYDRLLLYVNKEDEKKLKDKKFLEVLNEAIVDDSTSYAFGKDKIYRMMGEFYEANGDYGKAIEYWEKAMEINSKVGIRRKYEALKKRI